MVSSSNFFGKDPEWLSRKMACRRDGVHNRIGWRTGEENIVVRPVIVAYCQGWCIGRMASLKGGNYRRISRRVIR